MMVKRKMGWRIKAFSRNEDGAAAVEFALVAVLFLTTLFGILEMGRIFWTLNTLQYAAESAARHYLTNTDISDEDLEDYVSDKMEEIHLDDEGLTVIITKSTLSDIDFIQIDLSYDFGLLGAMMPAALDNISLSSTARLPVP